MKKQLFNKELEWCSQFESRVETLKVLNIIGDALTDKGRATKRDLEKWISENADKYLELTGS